MDKRIIAGVVLGAALLVPRYVRGHEGHAHKLMGTVATRHENHLQIKGLDGKTSTIVVNEKTKIRRGTANVAMDDISDGERIVVAAVETKGKDGKTTFVATQVTLAKK